ncbi:unnamed protein product [Spirodela intermedia]|uniref:Uncharacterized protein n=1 Tax=Spirodela intermedia TaxID=51605 RepID=A0A7I8LCR1_SPIIN|nr:unnamed protein product [Spirodela intermedia]
MGTNTRQNVVDSSKTMGEVDSRVPFKSVKAAVSLFGGPSVSPDKFTVVKHNDPPPNAVHQEQRELVKEAQFHLAQNELNKFKEKLKNAEATRIQALAELEQAKRTAKELSYKLKAVSESNELALKASEIAKMQAKRYEEVNSSAFPKNDVTRESDLVGRQHVAAVDEVDAIKQVVSSFKKDIQPAEDAKLSALLRQAESRKFSDANMERAAQLVKGIAGWPGSLSDIKRASLRAHQDKSVVHSEKDVKRVPHGDGSEQTINKLSTVKKELDPVSVGNLGTNLTKTAEEFRDSKKENINPPALDSVTTVASGLDGVKDVLQKIAEEETSLKTMMESLCLELDNIKKESLKLKLEEAETDVAVSDLNIKLQNSKAELEAITSGEPKAQATCNSLISTFQQLTLESENARKKSETMKNTADELMREAETVQISLNEAQQKLQVALKDSEDAKAAEADALNQMKVLSKKAQTARVSTSESGTTIAIPMEEYECLCRKPQEFRTLAEMKVEAALAEAEAIRSGEIEGIARLERIKREVEEMKLVTEEALKRVEMAEAARRAAEGEMRRLRERDQRRANEAACRILVETQLSKTPSPPRTRVRRSNPPEKKERSWNSGKTSSKQITLLLQVSGFFQKKAIQVESGSLSYLPGEKPL